MNSTEWHQKSKSAGVEPSVMSALEPKKRDGRGAEGSPKVETINNVSEQQLSESFFIC